MTESKPKYLEDIEGTFPDKLKIGDVVYLVRRISGELLAVTLESVLNGLSPAVEVQWDTRHRYKLNLVKNEVQAIDATVRHRQNMKQWYYVWEPQREMLIAMFWEQKKYGRQQSHSAR